MCTVAEIIPGAAISICITTKILNVIKYLLILAVATGFWCSVATAQKTVADSKPVTKLVAGDVCPEFALKDTTGNQVSLKNLRGKYVYIDVWASWCYPCRMEVPHLKRLEEDLKGRNITFVGISLDVHDWRWIGMIQGAKMDGIQWRVLNKDFQHAFDIPAIPRFILLDPEGKIEEPDMTRPSDPKTKAFLLDLKGI